MEEGLSLERALKPEATLTCGKNGTSGSTREVARGFAFEERCLRMKTGGVFMHFLEG